MQMMKKYREESNLHVIEKVETRQIFMTTKLRLKEYLWEGMCHFFIK